MAVRFEPHAEPIPGYRLLDRLGAGGFGEVWRAEAPGGIFKAVKVIHGDLRSKDADLIRYAEQELKALKRVKQVRHPYLLTLDRYDIVEGRLLIVMELADCNLWDRFRECRDRGLAGIPRDELLQYMAETAEVLDLFNDQFQLQHLDIKPQNLFLLHNHVKVADFGQVKDLQGLMAQVTGGITPVYAAPETFDGVITRFCDQYSLACVYQELLCGVRPFDGCSMGQLLMQHLSLPPNLEPLPPGDRPALLRALAKKPEDRWPSVTAFVRALMGGAGSSGRVVVPGSRPGHDQPTEPPLGSPTLSDPGAFLSSLAGPAETPPPVEVAELSAPVFTPAPPELSGPGPLRPALVIGLGQAGLRVLQRLRFDLAARYGPAEMTPCLRTLYVDTDGDALDEARRARPADRLAALAPTDIFPAKLNRAAHYMKPRLNGRSLIEGWFDPQLLYRIPRTPQTLGIRLFGRLAFCDHYRPLMGKVQAELEAALDPAALTFTETRTGLSLRTNRPRVYVVAGLGGGTGGGMFLDMAYAVRTRLQRMGYDHPELVGVLILPPVDLDLTTPQALGNTYAALMELNHYSRSDTTFAAHYDDRNGLIREKAPPFSQLFFLPGSAAGPNPAGDRGMPVPAPRPRPSHPGTERVVPSGSRLLPMTTVPPPTEAATGESVLKPFADAADLIRLNLFTPLGRCADETRPADEADPHVVTLTAFGLSAFGWPRAEVVARTAAAVTRRLLKRWAAPDNRRAREVIPALAQARWSQLGMDPEAILAHLRRAADLAAGDKVEELIGTVTDPLIPRGWLARLPEPEKVALALDRLVKLLGPPASPAKRPPTVVEQALADATAAAGQGFAADIRALVPNLADDSDYRLAGVEELLRQFLATTDRLRERFALSVAELDSKAQAGFECLSQYVHFQKTMRKPSAGEFAEAIRHYPRARFQALMFRSLLPLYQAVRDALTSALVDVSAARQRLEAAANVPDPPEVVPPARRLMPPGCSNLADAADRFLAVLTEADLTEIDRRVQRVIEPVHGGLLQACSNSATGTEVVVAALYEEARAHLDARLGEVDLAAMFAERFGPQQQVERVIEQTYQNAEPAWIGVGPWEAGEVAVLGCPAGAGGEPLRELARRAVPVPGLPIADLPDDLVFYREWPGVPLAALPHLGPSAAAAYRALPDAQQCTPHARLDVTIWKDVVAQ